MSENNILVKLSNAGILKNNKWLVRDVDLEINKGQIVTLIGPNGSGKTTTAKIALGLYKNIEGKVERFTKNISYVPQKVSIDWTLPLRVVDFMVLTQDLRSKDIGVDFKNHKKNEMFLVLFEYQPECQRGMFCFKNACEHRWP